MDKTQYMISDAAKHLHVEAHVLRYWEDELKLRIPRNKLGHRIYGAGEMALFRQILMWKKEGLSLKEIQIRCQEAAPEAPEAPATGQVIPYPSEHSTVTVEDSKMTQFKQILGRIVTDAIHNNSGELTSGIASHVSTHVNKELDFLFREKEEADEKRFRQLDETIRTMQRARQEAAAAQNEEHTSKSRHFFGKK